VPLVGRAASLRWADGHRHGRRRRRGHRRRPGSSGCPGPGCTSRPAAPARCCSWSSAATATPPPTRASREGSPPGTPCPAGRGADSSALRSTGHGLRRASRGVRRRPGEPALL